MHCILLIVGNNPEIKIRNVFAHFLGTPQPCRDVAASNGEFYARKALFSVWIPCSSSFESIFAVTGCVMRVVFVSMVVRGSLEQISVISYLFNARCLRFEVS